MARAIFYHQVTLRIEALCKRWGGTEIKEVVINLNITKKAIIPKLIYRFNLIPIKFWLMFLQKLTH